MAENVIQRIKRLQRLHLEEVRKKQHDDFSKEYNKAQLPEFIKPINDKLGTVAYVVIKNDSIIFEEYWNGYSADSSSILEEIASFKL